MSMLRMMIVFSVAALLAVEPVGAQSAAPVTISVCSGGISSIELVEIASYDVTVRNMNTVPADELRLSARYGRHEKRATFDLKGPFPPGIDVSRHLRRTVSGGLFAYRSGRNDCSIDYVRFSDGSTWSRPARQ